MEGQESSTSNLLVTKAKNHKQSENAAAMFHRMTSFLIPKHSPQNEKVSLAELTEAYHNIKPHISYVDQDCSLKILKQVINDSDIMKQMAGGRTIYTALENQVISWFNGTSAERFEECDDYNKGNNKLFPVPDSFEDSRYFKEQLCQVLAKVQTPWNIVTACGADNASVNFGVNNSVFQKLKSE